MEFAATTHYHWSNFDGNATQKGKHEIVQGPFQFGLADKLDKTNEEVSVKLRVSVQGVKSLGGHFACLCRGFEFYEVKKKIFCYHFSKRKWKYFYTFNHFYSEKSSKRAK